MLTRLRTPIPIFLLVCFPIQVYTSVYLHFSIVAFYSPDPLARQKGNVKFKVFQSWYMIEMYVQIPTSPEEATSNFEEK
ncbi:uncharacterized protein EURHEDRAFT_407771 [Aspergillus ruber CBS 135680]|uniref:Uncharacterized protein n=1 Tax=Aspergillus ruber (strain CBS 135680) TaxID=1388766 RepID=A0A017SRZ9_ASPRC|nr:uncharacterized protein EURHEDRAFT_407771 [Aspergillus ruber CBS 135680]EYE99772.1 hypothetical protein EURHEDRAFT_407771 [Aspergillus ruber CBS 135680]